jgi:hypothetical protein
MEKLDKLVAGHIEHRLLAPERLEEVPAPVLDRRQERTERRRDREVRIMGSKSDLLRTLAAIPGVKSATGGVRSSVLDWRRGRDSNPR